jgi:hypothetical protein
LLQRHFGRFDILFFLICTIVGVDTVATVAQGGGGPEPRLWTWPQNRRPQRLNSECKAGAGQRFGFSPQ